MCVAYPSCVASIGTRVNSSAKSIATFIAYDFTRKSVALLIFFTSTFNSFFIGSLFYQSICGIKISMTDNCFMMFRNIISVKCAIIFVPIKITVCVGFLENAVTGIFFICDDSTNTGRSPASTFLTWNLS